MIGRILRSKDFERVLGTPTRARSAHFALHHLSASPSRLAWQRPETRGAKLSTGDAPDQGPSVDDSELLAAPDRVWVGAVVPKRHAKRSVTRSLLKRQIRAAVDRQRCLTNGLWVVRLRAPFNAEQFISAASQRLNEAARDELDALLASAVRRRAGP